MLTTATPIIDQLISDSLKETDEASLRAKYSEQDEFVIVDEFLPLEVLSRWELELARLKPHVHRNYLPGHKKGGSVAYQTMNALAPSITRVYHSAPLLGFLRRVVGAEVNECPSSDPHRCALYAYTEEGDHMGWHYDTSYYQGRRYTVLIGLVDQSSCRLEYQLYCDDRDHKPETHVLALTPGTLVIFNGDKLYHRITPLRRGERRIALTLEYVTDVRVAPLLRFVSTMKDAIVYFGFRSLFQRGAA